MKNLLSERIINRLTQYHAILRDYAKKEISCITSSRISELLNIDETQVRKDIKSINCKGKCKVGYKVMELKAVIEDVLDFNILKKAVVIGAGNLGVALSKYAKFSEFGLDIICLFDTDENKIGSFVDDKKVYKLSDIKDIIAKENINIAILTIPNKVAQEVTDFIVKAGIKYIWNFAPTILSTPSHVCVWNENLIGSFLQFCALSDIK